MESHDRGELQVKNDDTVGRADIGKIVASDRGDDTEPSGDSEVHVAGRNGGNVAAAVLGNSGVGKEAAIGCGSEAEVSGECKVVGISGKGCAAEVHVLEGSGLGKGSADGRGSNAEVLGDNKLHVAGIDGSDEGQVGDSGVDQEVVGGRGTADVKVLGDSEVEVGKGAAIDGDSETWVLTDSDVDKKGVHVANDEGDNVSVLESADTCIKGADSGRGRGTFGDLLTSFSQLPLSPS